MQRKRYAEPGITKVRLECSQAVLSTCSQQGTPVYVSLPTCAYGTPNTLNTALCQTSVKNQRTLTGVSSLGTDTYAAPS